MRKNRDNRIYWRCVHCGTEGVGHMNPRGELFPIKQKQSNCIGIDELPLIWAECYPDCPKISIFIPPSVWIWGDGTIREIKGTL